MCGGVVGIRMKLQMNELQQRISVLPPAKRRILQRSLLGKVTSVPELQIPRRNQRDPVPLSSAQEGLWFLDQLEPGAVAYNSPIGLHLEGKLNVPVLHECLRAIVRRHESLRTRFQSVDGMPVQIIDPLASVDRPVGELRSTPEGEKGQHVKRW